MDLLRITAFLFALGLALLLARCKPNDTAWTTRFDDVVEVDWAAPRPSFFGLAIQVDSAHQPVERYARLIEEVAEMDANCVLLSVNGYQSNAGSSDVYVDPTKTPTDEQWKALINLARGRGLKTIVMPKILLARPRGREWRGVIDPVQQWDRWFHSYGQFILHYAELSADCGVDLFLVGSELVSSEKQADEWRELIKAVRRQFPQGLLGYSANWDHYASITFWDDLDVAGMTSYYKTAKHPGADVAELKATWARRRAEILEWQRVVQKPILFTEVGWCSQEGCSVEPWNYYRSPRATPAALEEQRRNYAAFIDTWMDSPGVAGTVWWEWTPGPGGAHDNGYTPKNKPAQQVLHDYFRRLRQRHNKTSNQSVPHRARLFDSTSE